MTPGRTGGADRRKLRHPRPTGHEMIASDDEEQESPRAHLATTAGAL
jgi:hypothetical protein